MNRDKAEELIMVLIITAVSSVPFESERATREEFGSLVYHPHGYPPAAYNVVLNKCFPDTVTFSMHFVFIFVDFIL